MNSFFRFGGESSADHGLIIERKSVYSSATPDLEGFEVPGRDGTLYFSTGRMKNVVLSYDTLLNLESFRDFPQYTGDIKRWLLGKPGEYQRLEDSYDPDHFRLAVCLGPVEIKQVIQGVSRQTAAFSCMPYRYRKTGEKRFSFTAGGSLTLNNDTGFTANPMVIIRLVKGNLDDAITVAVTNTEYGTVYSETVDGIPENQALFGLDGETQSVWSDGNYFNFIEKFPIFQSGKNTLTVSGERVKSVEVVPQWREL